MLKFTLIFLLACIAYAAQTRIKIGSKGWGYQIDRGQQRRQEFSNENGITTGVYLFPTADNKTKMLQYTIDPNRMEPDIIFDVVNVDDNFNDNNSSKIIPISSSTNNCEIPNSNMTFDSIDSNQDFKGHVSLKVGNSSYSLNFATGDRSNSREEVLTPSGLLYGRYNYMIRNSPYKIVINYKFNSSSPDPTYEVSLFKSSDHPNEIPSGRDRDRYRDSISNSISYTPSSNYRATPYHRGSPYAAGVPASHNLARAQAEQASRSSLSEKYRPSQSAVATTTQSSSSPSWNPNQLPSWYYNRNKSHDS